jgi:gentisate 1,2-dioxygenase
MAFQMLNPGETVDSHRHTATQMRFMVDGHGAFTTSDGEELYMEPGDLLVQPNWSWHGSTNNSDEPAIWVDAQDRNLTLYLGAFRRDSWAEGGVQPTTQAEGFYSRKFGMVRPDTAISGNTDPAEPIPPIRYRWEETLQALNEMAEAGEHNPYDGVLLEYTNPVTGGHTVPTMSACIQMLRPGEQTQSHRHTGTAIYHVVQGSGISSVGGDDLAWERRDCFTVPPLQWHSHRNTSKESAIMFSINDRPTLEALQLYHEEAR